MYEHIATIQAFLQHGELRITRHYDIYRILEVDERGLAQARLNPAYDNRRVDILLTRKELADLASLCFPPES